MRLTVLSVAYPLAPVADDAAGGAEQVLSLVDSGLIERGHRSIVVACEGSRTAGELVALPASRGPTETSGRAAWGPQRAAVQRLVARERVDLVHLHGLDFHAYLPRPGIPAVVTLHLPPAFYPPQALAPRRPETHLVCVSAAQRRACPRAAAIAGVVANGVALEQLSGPLPAERSYAACVGRICPEKGFHLALDAAREVGIELRLAGRVFPYPSHLAHFEQEIAPRLDGLRCFVGPVGLEEKRRLLAGARCLLVPSLVDETSSLVAMEALACGTPVIAYHRGALPEIVEHGRTGFLVATVSGMAEAIRAVGQLDPEACRAAARERFAASGMVERYLALYCDIVGRTRSAPARPPVPSPVAPRTRGAQPRLEAGA